jgi:HSP20 family protein
MLPRRWFERGPLAGLWEEMDDLFENFIGESGCPATSGQIVPNADVSETDEAIEVKTDLPGIKPNEIDIEVHENILTIRGRHSEKKEEKKGNGRKYHRVERRSGSFSRSVWLPTAVQEDKVRAELHDGVLTITLPKSEEAKPHKIQVKT